MAETGSQAFVKIYFWKFTVLFSGSADVSECLKHKEAETLPWFCKKEKINVIIQKRG